MNRFKFKYCWIALLVVVPLSVQFCGLPVAADDTPAPEQAEELSPLLLKGQELYASSCAECHGDRGEGVESAYGEPLIGDDSVGQLAELISDTMPEGDPEACVGEDAEAVAAFIHYSFYSEAARIRNRPPRVSLARLTATQLRQSYADLYEQFDGSPRLTDDRGVRAVYFNGDRWKNENKKIERVDPVIDFDWGRESPGEGIEADGFYINWQGAIRADITGRYEIIVDSTCSFVMDFGRNGRQLIDNHVQSGDKTEFRRSLLLTAGRVYPFKIDFKQRKRKTELPPARIRLSWVPPGGVQEVIPTRNLVDVDAPPTFSLETSLPPDDRSYGFERGIAINRQWDTSTTAAALEFAQVAIDELWPAYLNRHKKVPGDTRQKMDSFLTEVLTAAFRGPLDNDLKNLYITKQLQAEPDDAEAIKRVLLVALKSPRFLYPQLDSDRSPSQRVANRLALVLYDSLPTDLKLQRLVDENKLTDEEELRRFVREHVDDYRVRAKTRDMMHEWLNVGHFGEITKNGEAFDGFDKALVSDMRQSLDAFLDEVVWSEASDYRQLFTADWAYSTERMGAFLGEKWQPEGKSDGEALQKVQLDSGKRFGMLTHPYLLSGLAYYDTTSPIHRGVFLIRFMLGRTLRPPSEAFTPLSPDLHPDLTTRERVSLQTSPESCQVCHSKINPLGFVLESYDAAGRYRADEKSKPIDTSGSYTNRSGDLVEFTGPADLARYLADSDEAQRAFVARLFQHFVKQPPAAYGPGTLDDLTEKFREANYSIRALIVEVAIVAATPRLAGGETLAKKE